MAENAKNEGCRNPEEMHESEHWTDPLGIERYMSYDGNRAVDHFVDPGWPYIYDEDDTFISCPSCGEYELRYSEAHGICCAACGSQFADREIEDWASPWHLWDDGIGFPQK